jgi:hypothetical protein
LFYCDIALRFPNNYREAFYFASERDVNIKSTNSLIRKMTRKTTFDLPHDLLQHAKHEAVERNTTLRALVIAALRKELGSHSYVRARKPTRRRR